MIAACFRSSRFIAFNASVDDAPVSSVLSAIFLPEMPPAALISSTANSAAVARLRPPTAQVAGQRRGQPERDFGRAAAVRPWIPY